MLTNADCTLFTPYTENGTTHYARTVLRGVHWQDHRGVDMTKTGVHNDGGTTVYIPMGVQADGGKVYTSPKGWAAADKAARWTLLTASAVTSKIVKGVVEQDIGDAYSLKQLDRDYDNVCTITAVDAKDYGNPCMQHWEVTAK